MPYHTPIGIVPDNYPHLGLLKTKAWIDYHEFTSKDKNGQEYLHRDWHIIMDPEKVQNHGRIGSSANNHRKFQMILDLIDYRASAFGRLDRVNQLNVAIGVEDKIRLEDGSTIDFELKKYEAMDWKQLNNELSRIGHHGYTHIAKKKTKADHLPTFDS